MANSSRTSYWIARALWFFPVLLFFLSIYLVDVAFDIHGTLTKGIPTTAEVLTVETTNRSEISYEYIDLRAMLPDGRVVEKHKMSIPHSFLPSLQGQKAVAVRVLPGADQEIVLDHLGRAHWRLAAIQAAMSFIGAVLLAVAVFAWNRYLRRSGDPALREPATA